MSSYEFLDHAVINVKHDIDGAKHLFKQIGFNLTPRGFHSHGSINHLIIFGNDYLEVIGIPKGKKIKRQDLMDASIGINGVVFKTRDINETQIHLKKAGFDSNPPMAFHRPVKTHGRVMNAKFQTTTVRSGIFPGGRVYFCQHDTPDLVWRSEWQTHPNGAQSIMEFVTVTNYFEREIKRFATLLNTDVKKAGNDTYYVNLNSCCITVLTPKQYLARYGELASPLEKREAIFGAIVLATNKLQLLNKLLKKLDFISTKFYPDRTIVRVTAYDTVLEFVNIE